MFILDAYPRFRYSILIQFFPWKLYRKGRFFMKILMFISSITGNTKKVALHAAASLKAAGHDLVIEDTRPFLSRRAGSAEKQLPPADLTLICFWCRRASMDDASIELLSFCQDRKIALIGTMGGNVQSTYGDRVRQNSAALVSEHNTLVGSFICQGKIQEERTERRRKLPKDHIHYLSDEAYARHLASRTHPDANDLEGAVKAVTMWASSSPGQAISM